MHECEWLEALVSTADHWAKELKEEPDNEYALEQLERAINTIHYIGEIGQAKLMDKFREAKSLKL